MSASKWFPQQLVAFLEAVWSATTEADAGRTAVERAAETLDAEIAAIVCPGRVVAVVGYPAGAVPVRELTSITAGGGHHELTVPDVGVCRMAAVALDYPPGATFILARAGPDAGLRRDEASLLRGMARVTSTAMRTQHLLDDERAAREESDSQATENARLLAELTQRQVRLTELASEQAALRRVAVLVAGGAPPEEVFGAVAEEAGRLLEVDFATLVRYDPQDAITVLGTWTRTGAPPPIPVGSRLPLGGRNLTTAVYQTGRPARVDYDDVSGAIGDAAARDWGLRSSAGVPIRVEGRLWGAMFVAFTREESLPADTEARLAGFTELVATAVANAQARTELRRFAEEQAALRRVATLVAGGAPPEEVFAAVAEEVGRLLGTVQTNMLRYDPDDVATIVAVYGRVGDAAAVSVGDRYKIGGRNATTLVFETGRPARIDGYSGAWGAVGRAAGYRSSVGVPISVEGRLWGVIGVASTRDEPLAADIEARMAGFTELVATAIADAQARVELRGFAEEQAALRRVATLVARAAPPEEVFGAVAEEVGRLLGTDFTVMSRYDPDGAVTVVGVWARTGTAQVLPVGLRMDFGGRNVHTLVFQTGGPERIDDYAGASGDAADAERDSGFRSAVGVPISVEDRLWGVMSVASTREEPLSADTKGRLAAFTELIVTALVNAEAQAALNASRARIVATADRTRRRIERNLHDGAQQRLVSLTLHLQEMQEAAPGAGGLAGRLKGAVTEVTEVLENLREIAHGIHPAILTAGGLRPALEALARRSAVPVSLDISVAGRLPEPVEIAAYYAVSEALTNTAKHAHASGADVEVAARDGGLRVCVRDDGRGGADFAGGSGLAGIKDRMEALGGQIWLQSPPGAGTAMQIVIPLSGPGTPGPPAIRDGPRR
jgi:signal transduction histidine kinase